MVPELVNGKFQTRPQSRVLYNHRDITRVSVAAVFERISYY